MKSQRSILQAFLCKSKIEQRLNQCFLHAVLSIGVKSFDSKYLWIMRLNREKA